MLLSQILKLLFLNFILLIIISCTTPYFGYSDTEWDKLSELEQEAVQAEYEKIIASREMLKHDNEVNKSKQIILRRAESR